MVTTNFVIPDLCGNKVGICDRAVCVAASQRAAPGGRMDVPLEPVTHTLKLPSAQHGGIDTAAAGEPAGCKQTRGPKKAKPSAAGSSAKAPPA